jgi:hypothetical protein
LPFFREDDLAVNTETGRFCRVALLKFVFAEADMALGWQEPLPRFLSDQPISEEIPMSTAPISGSSIYQQTEQYFQTRQSDLKQLGQDLGSGDLAGAQTEYSAIVTLGQSGPFASGNPFKLNQREQDFTAIGTALQAGGLAGAQRAFSTLESTFQKGAGSPAPITPPVATQNGPGSPAPITAPISTTNSGGPEIILNLNNGSGGPEQITINLNPTSGGGEQVSLSVGNQGSNEQQFTFNLAPNSNEQIVLNLLGEASSTGSSASSSSPSGGLSVSA